MDNCRIETQYQRSEVDDAVRPSLLDRIGSPSDLRRLSRLDLTAIASEVRGELIASVSRTGGHLGAGLGVVELTVALHYVFDTPTDKLVWDVSHQCYPHKILTGRRSGMQRLRQRGGPSGFTCRQESPFDPFGAAHSSTAISASLGLATARDLSGDSHHVVAVVGDSAMSGGLAMEGLNNAGAHKRRLIIVLNDNNMSIAEPTGALAEHLRLLREQMPEVEKRRKALGEHQLPRFVAGSTLFEAFGIHYAGPFDGHDVDEMVTVLSQARDAAVGPILLHVVTEKGHGYSPAVSAADRYHSVSPFDVPTGRQLKSKSGARSYTSVFAEALIQAAARDERIVAVGAAMPTGTGLDAFAEAFPDRCFDVGIAEQHAVTFCAGLASSGMKPFAAIYSTFLQRAYDQIVHDVAIQSLPVRFAIDRAGVVGQDGVTHQGSYDITMLACLPRFVLMAPSDEAELAHMVATAVEIDDRPSALRFPRGEGVGVDIPAERQPFDIGRGRIVKPGGGIAILSFGARLSAALAAACSLEGLGVSVTVADARFAKPIDDRLIAELARDHPLLAIVEEGAIGGFATQVVDSLVRQKLDRYLSRLLPMHLPDFFLDHDTPASQLARAGLDGEAIAVRIGDQLRLRGITRDRPYQAAAE